MGLVSRWVKAEFTSRASTSQLKLRARARQRALSKAAGDDFIGLVDGISPVEELYVTGALGPARQGTLDNNVAKLETDGRIGEGDSESGRRDLQSRLRQPS